MPSCLFGNTWDSSVIHEKAKWVCFNYMQPQKVKFKSVEINMKQVSDTLVNSKNNDQPRHPVCVVKSKDDWRLENTLSV